MPQMGVSVAEGTVVEWRKQPGDWVDADETLGEVSTDKIDTEIPSPASGRLVEILVQVGTTVDVGVTLARIGTGDGAAGEPTNSSPQAKKKKKKKKKKRRTGSGVGTIAAAGTAARSDAASPASDGRPRGRRLAALLARGAAHRRRARRRPRPDRGHGPRRARTQAGRHGGRRSPQRRVSLGRHLQPILHSESPYRPGAGGTLSDGPYIPPQGRPLSCMRATIGEHMHRSLQTAATCTTWIEVEMSPSSCRASSSGSPRCR